MLKFSIITTSYNQLDNLKFIKKKIEDQSNADRFGFEWIIADDGSTDGTLSWCKDNNIKHYHKKKNTGYDIVGAINNAAKLARGEYLVWIMGDTFPKRNFLSELSKQCKKDTLLTGVRFNMDWSTKEVVSPEWRVQSIPRFWNRDFVDVSFPDGYVFMTLNSMCMPKNLWDQMGGLPEEFDGYGKMDWYMAAWTMYHGGFLGICPKAIVYHRLHEEREDTPNSTKVFTKYLSEWRNQ